VSATSGDFESVSGRADTEPEAPSPPDDLLPGADIDGALRMPRGPVVRRLGRVRHRVPRTEVVSPTGSELAHLDLEEEPGE
jgi:hypothetical protein